MATAAPHGDEKMEEYRAGRIVLRFWRRFHNTDGRATVMGRVLVRSESPMVADCEAHGQGRDFLGVRTGFLGGEVLY